MTTTSTAEKTDAQLLREARYEDAKADIEWIGVLDKEIKEAKDKLHERLIKVPLNGYVDRYNKIRFQIRKENIKREALHRYKLELMRQVSEYEAAEHSRKMVQRYGRT